MKKSHHVPVKATREKWAIVDLGTNSLRFDIYSVSGKKISRIHREKMMIRLGDGVFTTGRIPPIGFQNSLKAFLHIKKIIETLKINKLVVFGTSALRSAHNAKSFIDYIKSKTGISIKVISGADEARLIAKGILSNVKMPDKGHSLLIDIGGGSTEITVCSGQNILEQKSFQLGANRLKQMFCKTIPLEGRRKKLHPELALRQYIRDELYVLKRHKKWGTIQLAIGSSGTIRTLAKILKKIGRGSDIIERYELSALISEMKIMTREQLTQLPGLEPKRVDLILAGAILLEEILFATQVRRLKTTDFALRDGILESLKAKSS